MAGLMLGYSISSAKYLDFFELKMFVFLFGTGEIEGVSFGRSTLGDGGDDIGGADPVRFRKVGEGPMAGMVGVGMIEASDLVAGAVGLTLDADEVFGGDFVAVLGVGREVVGRDGVGDDFDVIVEVPEEDTAALVRVSRFAVLAERLVERIGNLDHSAARPALLRCGCGSGVRELKQSALLPISISTPLSYSSGFCVGELRGTGSSGMARKAKAPSVEQIAEALQAHSFEVVEAVGAGAGIGLRVAKYGCAAVLVPHSGPLPGNGEPVETAGAVVSYRERPGAVVAGEIARLLDRGYQKFLKTSKYELPATAAQLQAIHKFTEELTQVTGGISLYNDALGTTSDVYEYDRVKGREAVQPKAVRPWELTEGH